MSPVAAGWEQIAKLPRSLAGGKAATLARLADLGALPAAWVGGSDFRGAVPKLLRALDGHERLIVRSSAAAEDGAKTSLAGHFTSVLCEAEPRALRATLEQVHAHALKVFATLLKGKRPRLGLLVQPALAAEASCVYFARSPLHRGRALASAAFGTCHAVVDGVLPCDTFVLDGERVESRRVVHKFEMTWLHAGGACGQPVATALGPSWLHQPYEPMLWTARVPRGLNDTPALDDDQLAHVARLGAEVEARLGFAPDLEVSFAGGRRFLLQARPITTAPPSREVNPGDGPLQVASPGFARGPVRVVRSLADAARVRRGDVVAVGATDPEYLPMLRKVSAVLSEEGSALTHTAIVARELQIPCLTGVEGATTGRFTDGQRVTVDAWRGRVSTRRVKGPRPSPLPKPAPPGASELIAAGKRGRAPWDCAPDGSVETEAWRRLFERKGR